MADHSSNIDDDIVTKRDTHYNQQRSSYRSSLNSNKSSARPPSRPRRPSSLHRLDDFDLDLEKLQTPTSPYRADSDTLPYPGENASPSPTVPYTRRRDDSSVRKYPRDRSGKRISRSTTGSRAGDEGGFDDLLVPEPWLQSYELNANSPPLRTPRTRDQSRRAYRDHVESPHSYGSRMQRSRRPSFPLGRGASGTASGSQLDITALPSLADVKDDDFAARHAHSKPTPQAQRASRYATELYTISYLIFFAIWGTLARLGLQALTFYPGAPVIFSELWANVAGTFIMGFLAEDRRLFRAEWGDRGEPLPEPQDRPTESEPGGGDLERQRDKARHGKVKKTIPMYIGLATGFCGSFTSFSSFIRDVFLALSNDLRSPINHAYPPNVPVPAVSTTVPRNSGDSFMAICATIFITVTACYSALKLGSHLALLLDPYTPTLPFRFTRRILDPLIVLLGWGIWLGAVLLCILPPHNAWRGQALFACVFAPIGCLTRYYISLLLNPLSPSFPLGTFAVNIFGTAVLGMAYDLQHVPLSATGLVGGSAISCQVLQGIMDGFCGALTTVSTWMLEIDTLRRRHAYVYGAVSVAAGLGLLVVIMGSVRWTVGWEGILCTT
ncbi:uncharacterized protein K460DRAFT_363355 [Cucurbitaria berberidis CBS 394.84]|uniref:Chromosome condensation protein n=1 Tax=Cucurbitaria berberidis CBS 394.84 TaxID=1168544 RepID=A0A9P4L9I8_9PLEO|nr:uncharacterized protein K460DRAFT_363355 [Cucurbitaria berberidis CBS 394.84]KAF1847251.1 hypothetical protein K460DRAFT_363355 [Cucurbitaria berberidis CBS 394.84]